jgi:hypothetical protein
MDQPRDDELDTAPLFVSRRGFLGGCGVLLAGGVAAGLSGVPRQAAAQTSGVNPSVQRLAFAFPGTPEVGTLLGARGGGIRLEALATGGLALAPDPVTITFTNQMARPFFEWFFKAARNAVNAPGTDVQIIGANLANQEHYRLTLRGARVAQVVWPRFSAGSTEVLRFGATLVPESAAYTYLGGSALTQPMTSTAKALIAGRFRLGIQGLEAETAQVTRIDAFTQRLMPLPGASSAVVSNDALRLELPAHAAAAFSRWQADLLAGKAAERSGVLQFLASDLKLVGQALLSGLSVQAIDVAPTSAADGATVVAGSMLVSLNFRAIEFDRSSFG